MSTLFCILIDQESLKKEKGRVKANIHSGFFFKMGFISFLVFLTNLMDTLKSSNRSNFKPSTDPFCVAIFPAVAVVAFSKIPVERSSALESRLNFERFN